MKISGTERQSTERLNKTKTLTTTTNRTWTSAEPRWQGSYSIAWGLSAVMIECVLVGSIRSKEFPVQTQVFFWNPSFLFSPFPLSLWHFLMILAIGVKQKLLLPASKGSFSRGNIAAFPRLLAELVWFSGLSDTLVWCLKVSLKVSSGQPQSLSLPIYSHHKVCC